MIEGNLLTFNDVDMTQRQSTTYRARQRLEDAEMGSAAQSYELLPSYLQEVMDLNEGSTCCLQLDDQGRFHRSFMALGCSVRSAAFDARATM